ncbi:MAG: DUF3298 and DUF4163 domain-containing protein [Odoribacter sp.]|nr:DUF3298 and DUF4163 domain-containing protein [Odoribacter sp.]
MKTKLFTAFILALSVLACKKEIKLEMKQIRETDKTKEWNITINRPVFSSTETEVEQSCIVINDEITGLVNGIKAAFQEQVREQYASLDSAGLKPAAPYELYITDSIFMADNEQISVLISAYEMLGGANGNTNYYAINYRLKTREFMTPEELLDNEKAAAINALLKEYLKDPEKCYTFEVPTTENFTALNFTRHTVEFTYAKYILGPGSCGPVTISIPRTKMQGMLKP